LIWKLPDRVEGVAAILCRGKALAVSGDLDLIEVAFQISDDNAEQVQQWMMSAD